MAPTLKIVGFVAFVIGLQLSLNWWGLSARREPAESRGRQARLIVALVRIKLGTDPQEHIVHSLTRFWFCGESLPTAAALGLDVRLFHVDVVEVKVAIDG
jgi:hypothetical protein